MVLSYKPLQNTTAGFLGFQSSGPDAGLGRHIISMLKNLGSRAFNPMLLPALSYSIWIDTLNDEHGDIALTLQSVQDQTGLMEDYLQQKRIAEDVVHFRLRPSCLDRAACLPDEWYLRLRCEFWPSNR
jgi:hypothetical protein